MARNSLAGNLEDAPLHVRVAQGVSRDWISAGRCTTNEQVAHTAWVATPGEVISVGDTVVRAEQLIEMALMVCFGCPAQYDCAQYALDTAADVGTWSLPIDGLRWLRRLGEEPAKGFVEACRDMDIPLQVAVREARGVAKEERRRLRTTAA